MPNTLAEMGVPRVYPNMKDADIVRMRHAFNLIVNTTQVIQATGTNSEPSFAGLTLPGFNEGDVLVVGPGGVVQGSSGGGGGGSLMSKACILRLINDWAIGGTTEIVIFNNKEETGGVTWADLLGAHPTRITVDEDGLFLVNFSTVMATGGGPSFFELTLLKNGAVLPHAMDGRVAGYLPAIGSGGLSGSITITLVATDYIELQGVTPGALDNFSDARLSVVKLGSV